MQHVLIRLLLLWPAVVWMQSAQADDALDGIDTEIRQAMQQRGIPGVAVGVVRDGQVVLARGYGVREVGGGAPVDADTVFSIASMSKSFTSGVMATLVDEGKLDWDTPVRTYLPEFEMYDPAATRLLTPRDLLSHRAGMPRHDFLRFSTHQTPSEVVRRLRYLPPNRGFRDRYQYSNLMYAAAGYLASEVAGSSWDALVKERIFQPLGMVRSTTSVSESLQSQAHALPHLKHDGSVGRVDFYDYTKFGVSPAGAIGSTANDMLKYLQMYLDGGRVGDKQIISEAQVKELMRPVVVSGDQETYGLGWARKQRRGQVVAEHSGSITGFTSQMILLPERRMGVVVLNNLGGSDLPGVLGYYLVDRLLGETPEKTLAASPERVWPDPKLPERVAGTRPSLGLDAYIGEYFHPAYGAVRVVRHGAALGIRFDAFELPLMHHHYDIFYSKGDDEYYVGRGLYQFELDTSGRVAKLVAPLEPAVEPFVFIRR